MIDIYLYPSAVPIVDIILSDPLRARSLILGRDDKPPGQRLKLHELQHHERPIVAWTMYTEMRARYGVSEGQRVYFAMEDERKGPFAPGAKYDVAAREDQPRSPHIDVPPARRQ